MITESFKNQLSSALIGKHINMHDFEMKETESDEQHIVYIYYKYKKEFSFSLSISDMGDLEFVEFTPGTITSPQTRHTKYISEVHRELKNWIQNIEVEFFMAPENRVIKNNEEKISEIENMINDKVPDGNFNDEEIDDLKSKLDELENKLTEQIQRDNDQDELISELKKEIEWLKIQSDVLTKKDWMLSFSTRMYLYIQKNPRKIQFLEANIYHFLPEGVNKILPQNLLQLFLPEPNKEENQKEK